MSRVALSLHIPDLSGFAKSVREQLGKLPEPPSHVEMLNLLCRSAGFQELSTLQGRGGSPAALCSCRPRRLPHRSITSSSSERCASSMSRVACCVGRRRPRFRIFVCGCCGPALESRETFTEKQISELIKRWHVFGDHALLRAGADRLATGSTHPGWQRISTDRAEAARRNCGR